MGKTSAPGLPDSVTSGWVDEIFSFTNVGQCPRVFLRPSFRRMEELQALLLVYYSCRFAKNAKNLHRGSTIDASNIHIQSIQEHGFNFQNKIPCEDWNAAGAICLSCLIFTRHVPGVNCQSNEGSRDPGVTWRRTHKSKEICRKWIPFWSFN